MGQVLCVCKQMEKRKKKKIRSVSKYQTLCTMRLSVGENVLLDSNKFLNDFLFKQCV